MSACVFVCLSVGTLLEMSTGNQFSIRHKVGVPGRTDPMCPCTHWDGICLLHEQGSIPDLLLGRA